MSRIGRVLLGLLITVAGVVAPAEAATAGSRVDGVACGVAYHAIPATGGFTAVVIVRNTGTVTIQGWTLSFPLDEGLEVTDSWHAEVVSRRGLIVARNKPYNGVVTPGASIGVGFRVTGTAEHDPSTFTVNGVSCTIG